MTRTLAAVCLACCSALPVQAQEPAAAPEAPAFFTRYDFHLAAAALASGDERFSWDVYYGGDIDVFDYVVGRTTAVIDLQIVLGSEFRPFDPNQNNYVLEVASSYRFGRTELAGLFHHVSRHLSDRPKRFAIAWNIMGARVLRRQTVGTVTLDLDADLGWVTQHAQVDYKWAGNADVTVRRQISPRVSVFAKGSGHLLGVHADERQRGTQTGGSAEGGVRLSGVTGAAEFFAGFESRIDADPFDFRSERWFMVGFRLLRQ